MSLGEFLYHTFKLEDEDGIKSGRSGEVAATVSQFLRGNTKYSPCDIIDAWFRNRDGRVSDASDASELMFSTTRPYSEIKEIRPCLTSFAVQTVCERLIKEAENAIKPENGLHISTKSKSDSKKLEWADIGANTVSRVADIIQDHQPVTWHLLSKIAARPPRKRKGIVAERQSRPIDGVSTSFLIAGMKLTAFMYRSVHALSPR